MRDRADEVGGHPFIAHVGVEEEVAFRVRHVVFDYGRSYRPFAIPRIGVTFLNHDETKSAEFDNVIPDTGADLSVLPYEECEHFGLFESSSITSQSSGVIGESITSLIYRGFAEIDGLRVEAYIHPLVDPKERLIGRDVLNQHVITFDGPAGRVVFNADLD